MRARALLVRTGVVLGATGLALAPHLVSASPSVTPSALAGTVGGGSCVKHTSSASPATARVTGTKGHARLRDRPDHARIAAATLHRVNAELRRVHKQLVAASSSKTGASSARTTSTTSTSTSTSGSTTTLSSSRLPAIVYIRVYAHNVYGKHAGERDLGSPAIKNAIVWLNRQYAHGESSLSYPTRFRFSLMAINVIRSDSWYHSAPDSSTDQYFKRKYHRGTRRDLNLYFREPRSDQGTLLGYSRFPWQSGLRLDGVTVHPETLPWRKLAGFNQNNTMTHEVGHWLGLLHVFQGGCADQDGVADTPAMADGQNVFECQDANTCPLLGLDNQPDPIHNYMDYTPDPCMLMFTRGQAARMDAAWVKWRQNG